MFYVTMRHPSLDPRTHTVRVGKAIPARVAPACARRVLAKAASQHLPKGQDWRFEGQRGTIPVRVVSEGGTILTMEPAPVRLLDVVV